MCKSLRGDSDRPGVGDSNNDAHRQSMVDMSDPCEVRRVHAYHGSGHKRHCHNEEELNFDNPYGDSQSEDWHAGDTNTAPGAENGGQSGEQQCGYQPGDLTGNEPSDQLPSPMPSQPIDQATISELTALSEAKLPNHANGSYPSTGEWEGLHAKMVERAQKAAQDGSRLVFYGDSITEAMGYNPDALATFQKNFGQENPTPLAIGGDGTNQLLYRVNHGELQGEPKVAVVMIGTNDIGSLSTQQIKENTAEIIDSIQARSPNTKVLLMGVLPRTLAGDPGNYKVGETNAALSQLATSDGAVQFADINENFVDANGNEISNLYQADGLHLTPAGYQVWANSVNDQLANMLNSPDIAQAPGDVNSLDVGAIRGVNLDGADWPKWKPGDTEFWPTADELDYFKSKGMNTIRLPINWEQFQPSLNGPLDQSELNQLDKFMQAAAERGMKVIIDLQNFDRYTLTHGPGGSGLGPNNGGTVVGEPGVPVSAFQDFWSKLVRHVDANAAYSEAIGGWDLMNEPNADGHTWVNTATKAVQAIRATGDNHAIIVEGDEWARDFSGFEGLAKSDTNVVFEAHSYWDDGSGGYANPNPPANANVGVDNIRPFVEWLKQNNARGFVGEWGVPTRNTAWNPAITNFIRYLNQNGVGNIVWSGGPGWKPDYTLGVEPVNGQDVPVMAAIEAANRGL